MRVKLPVRYPFAEKVPSEGASCSTCHYLGEDGASCRNKFYRKAHGGPDLGAKASRWCCMAWSADARK